MLAYIFFNMIGSIKYKSCVYVLNLIVLSIYLLRGLQAD